MERYLFKKARIIDGTGSRPFIGDLLINGGTIEAVSPREIDARATTFDCTGKTLAPGFIDMHSHNDWFLPNAKKPEFTLPFTEQGITTFVAGNCGFSAAGLKPDSPYKKFIEQNNLFQAGTPVLEWASMAEYFERLETQGITHNLAILAGHGTTRASICGWDPALLGRDQTAEMLSLLDQAMDEGAKGVSFGLQYAPGIFTGKEEMRKVADLVRKRNKILTVHLKAYSSISTAYPVIPMGTPHNLIALKEALDLARETGVRLQLSHMIFVGKRSWKTFDRAMEMIETALSEGVDVKMDTYTYSCGASIITVLLPDWFLAAAPKSFTHPRMRFRVRLLAALSFRLLGFGFEDIQIASAIHDPFEQFNGMFLSDIARERNRSPFDNFMDFVRESRGTARVLMHKYSSPKILEALLPHRETMLMTDAWAEPRGIQNPAVYGCFPRFIQTARDAGCLSDEAIIRKITGAAAQQFNLRDRGTLEKGKAADLVILDWDNIRDNTSPEKTEERPSGIEAVFINGIRVAEDGRADPALRPGRILS